MIVDTILGFITSILNTLFSALPSWSIVSSLGLPAAGSHSTTSIGYGAGIQVAPFDALFPIHETIGFLYAAFLALLAAYAIYKVANWLWRHFPDIGGFGPGAG